MPDLMEWPDDAPERAGGRPMTRDEAEEFWATLADAAVKAWEDDAPEPFDVLNETLDGYVTNWDGGGDAMRWESAS